MTVLVTTLMIAHPVLVTDATELLRHMTVDKDSRFRVSNAGSGLAGLACLCRDPWHRHWPGQFPLFQPGDGDLGCTGLIGATAMIVHVISAFADAAVHLCSLA
jgi:hypothetical protein